MGAVFRQIPERHRVVTKPMDEYSLIFPLEEVQDGQDECYAVNGDRGNEHEFEYSDSVFRALTFVYEYAAPTVCSGKRFVGRSRTVGESIWVQDTR